MKRSVAYGASVFLATAVWLCGAAVQAASAKEEAKQHFDAGNALIENEDYAAATAEFELSVRLFPTKMGLFNLANCYKALTRYGDALDALARLQREFSGKLGELATEVAALQSTIEGMVGGVTVRIDRDGATVFLDNVVVGTSPLAKPLVVAPGDHAIGVRLAGYQDAVQIVRVVARTQSEVSLALAVALAAPAAPALGAPTLAPGQSPATLALPPPPAVPAVPLIDDQAAVEAALGKDLGRLHTDWLQAKTKRFPRFSDYAYEFYKGKKRKGVILAAVLGPVFLVLGGALSAAMFSLYENTTTCDQVLNFDADCERVDGYRTAGGVFAGVFGAAALTFIGVGIGKAVVNKKRMLKVDAARKVALRGPRLEFAGLSPLADASGEPSGLALQWVF